MENELSAYQRKFPSKFVQPNQKLGYRNELERAMNKNTARDHCIHLILFEIFDGACDIFQNERIKSHSLRIAHTL